MPPNVVVSVTIPAPPDEVWDDIADIASHSEWMTDAESIRFLSTGRAGTGTRIEVATRVGPFRLRDVMEFTTWDPPHTMGIRHQGLVSGTGTFTLVGDDSPGGAQTRFLWEERLRFPWYLGGRLTAHAAVPVLGYIWKRNLDHLAARFE